MANKKIDNSTLIDKDFLDNSIKKFEDLLSVTNQTIDAFKGIASEGINMAKSKPFEGYANLKEISKGIEQFEKAVKGIAITEAKQALFSKEILSLKTKQEAQRKNSNKTIKEQSTLLKKQNAEIKKQTSVIIKQTKETDKLTVALENEEKKKAESAKNSKKLTSVFDEQKKRLNDLKKEYKEQAITLGENSDEAQGLLVEITKLNDAMNAIEKSTKSVTKEVVKLTVAETEQEKLKKRLLKLSTQEAKDTEEIRQKIVATQKAIRDEVKERITLLDEYQKQSKALNENRKAYKNLFLETENSRKGFKGLIFGFTKAGKELKKLRKEVNEADDKLKDLDQSVGQSQRKVGDYERAWKGLNSTLKKLGGVALVIKIFEGLSNAFSANSRTGAELEKVLGRFTVTLSVLVSRFADAIPTIKLLFTDFVNSSKRSLLEFQLSLAKTPLLGDDDKAKEIQKEIDSLAKDSGKSLSDLGKAFEGVGDEIAKTIEANDRLIDTTLVYRKEISNLVIQQSKLLKSEAELQVASGGNTESLKQRRLATEELIAVQGELNNIDEEIALKEQELAQIRVNATKDNIGAQEQLAQATLNLETVRAKAVTDRENGLKELRDIESDDIERRLDFLIDLADKQKAVNDAIIADDTATFKEREDARLANLAIEADLLARSTAELNRATKEEIDLNSLKTESDNLVIAEKSKNAGLNDRLVGRVLELIRDDIDFTREQKEGKKELSEAEKNSNLVKSETILIQEALNKSEKDGADLSEILIDLSDKRLQAEIDNLNLKIALLKDGSEAELEAKKQLNEKLLEQAKTQADKEKDVETDKQARLQELRQLGIDGVRAIAEKELEATTANIDREISALEARESTLRELASRGVENVENNLALEQKRRAELEAKRAQAVKRQQQVELGLAVLKTYSNKVGNGDKNALGSTIANTSLLLSFISSLPAFYEGADRVGDNLAPTMSGKDGHVVRVDGDEMVMNGVESKMIRDSGMSRLEVATMAQMSDKGMRPIAVNDNSAVVKGLQDLKIAIDSKPVYDFKYDDVKKAVADVVESRGRLETSWRKNSEFF
jgi:hypothetical protein